MRSWRAAARPLHLATSLRIAAPFRRARCSSTMTTPSAYSGLLSVAPMMEITDRHFRFFWRLLSKRSELWTEMVVDSTLLFSDKAAGFLRFNEEEHPVVCQLGGSDPVTLAKAAAIVKAAGFDGINLNCGCPSPRVAGRGLFGAALMFEPELVRDAVIAMRAATGDTIPISIKCRLGADGMDSYEAFARFIAIVSSGGAQHFVVHARKCLLRGLSPKDNRTVPPLRYHWVQRAALEFPHLRIGINGGVASLTDAAALLLLQRAVPRPLPLVPGSTGTVPTPAAAADVARAIAAVAAEAMRSAAGAAALDSLASPLSACGGAGASVPAPALAAAIPVAAALLATAALPAGVRADPRRTMSKAALRLQRRKEASEDAIAAAAAAGAGGSGEETDASAAAGARGAPALPAAASSSSARVAEGSGSDSDSDDSEHESHSAAEGGSGDAGAVGCGCELPNPPDEEPEPEGDDDAAGGDAAQSASAAAGPHARAPAVGGRAALLASGKAGADGLGPDGFPVDPMLQVAAGVARMPVPWLPDRDRAAPAAGAGAGAPATAASKLDSAAGGACTGPAGSHSDLSTAVASAAAATDEAAPAAPTGTAVAAASKAAAMAVSQAEQAYRYTFASHPGADAATAAANAHAAAVFAAAAAGTAAPAAPSRVGLPSSSSSSAVASDPSRSGSGSGSGFAGVLPLLAADPSRNLLESVMIGRAASNNPWLFADVDRVIYGVPNPGHSRREVIDLYLRYCEELIPARTPAGEREGSHRLSYAPATLMKPLLTLFAGCFGGSRFRGALLGNVTAKRMPLREAVAAALAEAKISDAVLDERPPAGP